MYVFLHSQLSNWEPGDRAVSEHQRHYPNCRFVRGDRADNVSLAGAAGAASGLATAQLPAGAATLSNVSNPAMQQSEERLLTFVNWPSRIPVRPDQLSKAGFYYVGKDKNHSAVLRLNKWEHWGDYHQVVETMNFCHCFTKIKLEDGRSYWMAKRLLNLS